MINILDFIDTISQVVIAISAIVAIVITVSQIRYKKKANAKGFYSFALRMVVNEETNKKEIIPIVNINIVNLGLAPMYLENCGLEFISSEKNKKPHGISTSSNIIKIEPGEKISDFVPLVRELLDKLDNDVSVHDKLYIYARLCNGRKKRWKTNDDYLFFKTECLKTIKRAEESTGDIAIFNSPIKE